MSTPELKFIPEPDLTIDPETSFALEQAQVSNTAINSAEQAYPFFPAQFKTVDGYFSSTLSGGEH